VDASPDVKCRALTTSLSGIVDSRKILLVL
jgi:hypothetical protein